MGMNAHIYIGPYVEFIELPELPISAGDIAAEIAEALHHVETGTKGRAQWVPNVNRGLPALPRGEARMLESCAHEVTAGDIDASIDQFAFVFAQEIEQMKRLYKTPPRFKFGVLIYWG